MHIHSVRGRCFDKRTRKTVDVDCDVVCKHYGWCIRRTVEHACHEPSCIATDRLPLLMTALATKLLKQFYVWLCFGIFWPIFISDAFSLIPFVQARCISSRWLQNQNGNGLRLKLCLLVKSSSRAFRSHDLKYFQLYKAKHQRKLNISHISYTLKLQLNNITLQVTIS